MRPFLSSSSPLRGAACVAFLAAACGLAALPAAAADVWTPLGPSGGTVVSLAVDPEDGNTVYAGSRELGIFRSANGGRSWQRAGELTGNVTWLAVAPRTRAVYAFVGGTIVRSRDGGASWTDLSAGLRAFGGATAVSSFALSPIRGVVYAVAGRIGSPAKLLRSTDFGNSWATAWVPPPGVFLSSVFTDPGDPRAVFAATFTILSGKAFGSVYASADGGATWVAGDLGDVAVTHVVAERGPRRRLMAAVSVGPPSYTVTLLYVSSDRGRTWRRRGGMEPLVYLFADPAPGDFIAVDYHGDVHRTTDAGFHWTTLGTMPGGSGRFYSQISLALAPDPVRPGVFFSGLSGGSDGRGLWKTANFGASWTPFLRGYYAGDFSLVAPAPGDPATLWAGAGVGAQGASPLGVWKSADRGATWAPAGLPTQAVSALLVAESGRLFAATDRAGLQRSDDSGRHWTRTSLPADTGSVSALARPATEPSTLYALAEHITPTSAAESALGVSLDGGATWALRLGGASVHAAVLAVAPASPATLYIDDRSPILGLPAQDRLLRSADRGTTWTTLLEVDGGFLYSIGLDPADPQRIVVSFVHLDSARTPVSSEILWTADGGATWSSGTPTPWPGSIDSVIADPLVPHGFLAGGTAGVFASADGGATWTPVGEGLPRVPVHLSLDPAFPRTLYAATQGAGIYRLERTEP
jgi:photosystem II stability/assembly factor-like uncharacterized protein